MKCQEIPARLYALHASNGDPLLLYGEDGAGCLFLWPTPHISRHKVAFARWTKRNVDVWRGRRILFNHPLCEATQRWATWLGVKLEEGIV